MKKYTFLALGLFITGIFTRNYFAEIFLFQLQKDSLYYGNRPFSNHLLFAFSIAILPFIYFLINKTTPFKSFKQQLITMTIIVLTGLITCEIYTLRTRQIINDFEIDQYVHQIKFVLEEYLLTGFLIGTIITNLILKKINSKIEYTY